MLFGSRETDAVDALISIIDVQFVDEQVVSVN